MTYINKDHNQFTYTEIWLFCNHLISVLPFWAAAVIGEPARGTEAVTVVAEDTDSKKRSSALPIAVCGIAAVGVAGAFIYFKSKK